MTRMAWMRAVAVLFAWTLGTEFSFGVTTNVGMTPPWRKEEVDGGIEYVLKYGGSGWPGLLIKAGVEPGKHYQLSWRMMGNEADPGAPVKLSVDAGIKFNNSYVITPGWSEFHGFFFSGDRAEVKLNLHMSPGAERTIRVKDLKLEEVTAEKFEKNLFPGGEFEDSIALASGWTRASGTETLISRVEESRDFLSGSRSMVLAAGTGGKGGMAVNSIYIPVLLGKKFEMSFWAKGEGTLSANIDGWSPVKHSGKHFYKGASFNVEGDWKQFSLSADIPENLAEYPDLESRMIRLTFQRRKDAAGEVWIDNVEFRQIEKQ